MRLSGEEMRKIREAIRAAFPSATRRFDLVVSDADIGFEFSDYAGQYESRIQDLLKDAVGQFRLTKLLKAAVDAAPDNPELFEIALFVDKYFAFVPRFLPGENDSKAFGDAERILFKNIGFQNVREWLDKFDRLTRVVCRIETQPRAEGIGGYGTGFLIGPDVILTNDHVASGTDGQSGFWGKPEKARRVRIRFDCEYTTEGKITDGKEFALAVDYDVLRSPVDQLDFALLKLDITTGKPSEDIVDGKPRGFADPIPHTFEDTETLFILQHPQAEPMKLAFGPLTPKEQWEPDRIAYFVNTDRGSSGSPCLTEDLDVGALHHWGSETHNRGVLMSAILAHFRAPENRECLIEAGLAHLVADNGDETHGAIREDIPPTRSSAREDKPTESSPELPPEDRGDSLPLKLLLPALVILTFIWLGYKGLFIASNSDVPTVPDVLTHRQIEEFIAETARRSAKELRPNDKRESDFSKAIRDLGEIYGLTEQEVRDRIGKWKETAKRDPSDFYRLGLAAFDDKIFDLAAENFLESARRNDVEPCRDYLLAGDSYFNGWQFQNAMEAYAQAQTRIDREREYSLWLSVSLGLANARANLGIRVDPALGNMHLSEAVRIYRELLDTMERETNAEDWATTQNNLGNALSEQGTRSEGVACRKLLEEAVKAYREALKVRTQADFPQQWAATQDNLGATLLEQGFRAEGVASMKLLEESLSARRAALQEYPRDKFRREWARTQNNLGVVLGAIGERKEGAAATKLLAEAVAAHREALTEYSRERSPQQWAGAQNNLGAALSEQGCRAEPVTGVLLLEKGIVAFREALTVFTRDQFPQDWANTQNNLGIALSRQGIWTENVAGMKLLEDSVAAYREALKIYTRDALPQNWARTQNNLGIALKEMSERTEGASATKLLAESATAYREALKVYSRVEHPQNWAMTFDNLGSTLREQGSRAQGADSVTLLEEAVAAYREALTVYTRDQFPQQWAGAQNNLGVALSVQGSRAGNTAGVSLLAKGIIAFREALKVFTQVQFPQDWSRTQKNLGQALREQGMRMEGAAGVKLLGEAVAAYRETVRGFTQDHFPQQWANAQSNLGAALCEQGIREEGAAGVKLLEDASVAFHCALQVFTQDTLPLDWVMTQCNLGVAQHGLAVRMNGLERFAFWDASVESFQRALRGVRKMTVQELDLIIPPELVGALWDLAIATESWEEAEELTTIILSRNPDDGVMYGRATLLYHDQRFAFDKAFALHEAWMERHPEHINAQVGFAESHFTTKRFSEGVELIRKLLTEPMQPQHTGVQVDGTLSTSRRMALLVLLLASRIALADVEMAESTRTVLVALVQDQPLDFRIVWHWTGTCHFIKHTEHPSIVKNRDWLLELIAATEAENRDEILKRLAELPPLKE